MAITLRPYQQEAFDAVRSDWAQGYKRVIVSSPTGTGKTWLFVFLIYAARNNGYRSIVLVNRDELVDQAVEKLARIGVVAGIVKGPKNEWTRDVVVASVQTLSKSARLSVIPWHWFGLVIVDECHYANARGYQRILSHFASAHTVGVTATPFRGDNESLSEAGWEKVSYVYDLESAIADGWLVEPRFETLTTETDLKAVKTAVSAATGISDFKAKPLEKKVNTDERNLQIANAYLERMRGQSVLGFCAGVEHAWNLANTFRQQGIDARMIYGEMPKRERRYLLEAHKAREFPVLTNCNILTHGYDDPGLNGVIMARPTKSKVLYVQCVGRGLRPSEGKTHCTILDVVDSSKEHDLAVSSEVLGLQRDLRQINIVQDLEEG